MTTVELPTGLAEALASRTGTLVRCPACQNEMAFWYAAEHTVATCQQLQAATATRIAQRNAEQAAFDAAKAEASVGPCQHRYTYEDAQGWTIYTRCRFCDALLSNRSLLDDLTTAQAQAVYGARQPDPPATCPHHDRHDDGCECCSCMGAVCQHGGK